MAEAGVGSWMCPFRSCSLASGSDALINQLREQVGRDHELPPFRIVGGGGLGGDDRIQRSFMSFELRDVGTDGDEHVPVFLEFGAVADRVAMPGNHNGLVG